MNPAKVTDLDYINFLVAAPKVVSCTEAARVQPQQPHRAAHDALTRLLHRLEPDSTPLWHEVEQPVTRDGGIVVVDDTTLDQPYAEKIALVHRHGSGKHHQVVHGINLVTLLWSDGVHCLPVDDRLYDKPNAGATKHDHLQAMLATAPARGFHPHIVAVDSWYGSRENRKAIRRYGWHWLTQWKSNRQVNLDRTGNQAVREVASAAGGTVVHLKGYGMVTVFRIVTADGDTADWATSNLDLESTTREALADQVWTSEVYHRGLKQFCGVERAQVRAARAQRNHIGMAIRAFVRLEHHRICTGLSWFETKLSIIRPAIQHYLSQPSPILRGLVQSPATA